MSVCAGLLPWSHHPEVSLGPKCQAGAMYVLTLNQHWGLPGAQGEGREAGGVWVPSQGTRCLTGNVCPGNAHLTCLQWGIGGTGFMPATSPAQKGGQVAAVATFPLEEALSR